MTLSPQRAAILELVCCVAVLDTSIVYFKDMLINERPSQKPTKVELVVVLAMNFGAFICHWLTTAFF